MNITKILIGGKTNTENNNSASNLNTKALGVGLMANQATINSEPIHPFLKPLVYLYRAYGHIVLENYDKAIKDYISATKFK